MQTVSEGSSGAVFLWSRIIEPVSIGEYWRSAGLGDLASLGCASRFTDNGRFEPAWTTFDIPRKAAADCYIGPA